MLRSDVQYLWCPKCYGDLMVTVIKSIGNTIDEGYLACVNCEENYPIINTVANFFSSSVRDQVLSVEESELVKNVLPKGISIDNGTDLIIHNKTVQSGMHWSKQFGEYFHVKKELLDSNSGFWSEKTYFEYSGIDKEQLEGNTVAIFCGGSGREGYHLGNAKTKKVIVLDIGNHINLLPKLYGDNAEKYILIRCDASLHPIRTKSVDIATCDHALQHIVDHRQVYGKISKVVVDKGIICICVYSFENNFLMIRVGEPLKRILRFVPLKILYYLCLVPASLLFISAAITYWLSNRISPKSIERIPLNKSLLLYFQNGFRTFWEVCFDLLQAPVSYHFTREEMIELAEENNQTILKLVNTFSTTWSMVATRKEVSSVSES